MGMGWKGVGGGREKIGGEGVSMSEVAGRAGLT